MANVKAAVTASEPAVSAEKEIQLLRQQAEIKNGEALIREISSTIAEQREKARSSDKDKEQDQPRDTAELSQTQRWFQTDGTVPADEALRWMLELAGKDWESFLEWWPDPDIDLPKQLQELSKLYLALLEATLKYAEGENLAEQMDRLDSLLAQKLDLLMEQDLDQLTSLLKQTGQDAELDNIRSSLYRQTAGRAISPQAAHVLFTQGRSARGGRFGFFTSPSSFSREGMIYQSSGKQNLRFQQAYHTQQNSWKEQLRQRNEIISNARKGIAENTFKQGSSVSCSGRELETANRFAAHINGSGNLFRNPDISAGNEEAAGLLAAVMSIKGRVYAGETGQASSITHLLQNAIEKIIDQYLRRRGAADVYYHTLAAYKQLKNPQKAIEDGRDYAYQQFREKQRDPAFQKSARYSMEAGFFRPLLKSLSPEKEFAMGISILQKDWQNFLHAMGNRHNSSYSSTMGVHSPWGALSNIGIPLAGGSGNIGKILLGAAVITIGALAVICFRFI